MITNADTLIELQSEWDGVQRMIDRMKLLMTATFAGGAFTAPALSTVVYNLPLLLAFDVLKQVLTQFRNEGKFVCSGNQLGPFVDASKTLLPWLDWQAIREGVRRRNEVAHDGILLESTVCIAEILRIKQQLAAWHIIAA